MECVIATKASMILELIDGLRGDLHITLEEGTSAAWLYDLLKPQVTKLLVCDPRRNANAEGVDARLFHDHERSCGSDNQTEFDAEIDTISQG